MITVINETTNDDEKSSGNADDSASAGAVSARGGTHRPPSLPVPLPSTLPLPLSLPPKLPGSTGMGKPPPDNSDLLNRLRNFLPRMESANQALLSLPSGSLPGGSDVLPTGQDRPANHSIRLDTNLQLDDSDDSDSDDSDSDDNDSDDANDGTIRNNPLIREVNCADDREPGGESTAEKSAIPTKHSLSESETATVAVAVAAVPTIQLQFSLGDMSDNPLMKLLAVDDDNDDNDNDENDDNDDENDNDSESGNQPLESGRLQSVSELLRETSNAWQPQQQQQQQQQQQPPIRLGGIDAAEASGGTKSDGPKPWITELS